MASKARIYECKGKIHPDKRPAVLLCGTCKIHICGECAVSDDHKNHSESFRCLGDVDENHVKNTDNSKELAEKAHKRLERKIAELYEAKSSRKMEFSNLRKNVTDQFKDAKKRLADEKRILEEGLNTEENIDMSNVDDLITRCIKRKETIRSLLTELEEKTSKETKEKMESSLQKEVDAASNEKKRSVKFRHLVLSEETRGTLLGCLEFDENTSLSSDFEGFLLPEPTILSKFQIRLSKIEAICKVSDSEVWIGYSKTDRIYKLEEIDGYLRKTERHRLIEFQPINISALSSGNLIISCAGQPMITTINTMNSMYEPSLYIDTYHLLPLGLYVNEKDEIFVCLVDQYGFSVGKSSFRQVTKYAADRERALVIERDNDGKRYFTMPQSVIENINGDICVVDVVDNHESRLMVFDKNGGKKFEYNGQKTTNSPKCDLSSVTHDSKGNIIISDEFFNRIHLLTKNGGFVGLLEIGKTNDIFRPFAIMCDSRDTLWIGCKSTEEDDASQLVHMSMPLPEENLQ